MLVRIFFPIIVVLSIILFGCDADQEVDSTVKATDEHITEKKNGAVRAKSLSEIYVVNPQVPDDTTLLQVGQTIKDSKGTVTLKGIATLNETVSIGPIQMKIKNVKLIHNLPVYSLMDYFHYYTEHYEEFDFVKVEVELINLSSETVHFGPIAHLNTSNEERKDFDDDFYIEYLGGVLEPKGSKQGALGFIVEKSAPDLQWIEIITSDALSKDRKEIGKSQEIKVGFN
ncbi:hypothetical protein [Bacillus sp. 165]|uniref:hypothetical protein n=1 Tax=Bacillus sp. 165 TaxID=1529117 RepID=UPI001ADA91CF|nr:hypothetical protein [Bacillus sp. 165]MBO9128936.1 hypothetical protein [Bacillus sp. 165]